MKRRTHLPILTFALIGLSVTLAASVHARLDSADEARVLDAPSTVETQVLGL